MANSVNISIEAPIENQIQEITYDGQEIYQAPLTMSENLTRLAQKIDFSKSDDEFCNIKKEGESSSDTKSEDDKEPGYQSSLWPWDSVRNKLRNALTEVSVLADVLSIAKEKRYMVLDPVQPGEIESRPMVQVYGRKKALAAAAAVLQAGVDRLRASETMRMTRNMPDFHIDLLRLRQNWRLKKVSNTIVGDLSYRTAGSKFSQTGVFEVTKAPEEQIVQAMSASGGGPAPSALRVTVPPELQGVAFISVMCQKEQEDVVSMTLSSSALNCPGGLAADGVEQHWQQKLEAAQNVLFCKELFARLAAEAVQLDASIPHMVVGNHIMATVLPGIQLLIGLRHNNGQKDNTNTENVKPEVSAAGKADHDHVLEHSLHQLLRAVHHANTHHPFPHPATGPLGPSKRRCLAGPMAADRYELLDMSKEQSLLEQIIQQAQHFFMRRRSEYVLDTIAKEVKDPLIVSHWNALNSPTQSCVKINIMAYGYDAVCRTSLVVHVGEKTLKCICRDGKVRHLSYELQELRDLIYCQIGKEMGEALMGMHKSGVNMESVHLVGHSLGAHIMGFAGSKTREMGKIMPRITGLDPARALFEGTFSVSNALDRTCARFVDIIHSDPGGYGTSTSTGTVDIWPNYGSETPQPGCPTGDFDMFTPEDLCSHDRAWRYFVEAIFLPTAFPASAAPNYDSWVASEGRSNSSIYLGDLTNPRARGNFYLMTNSKPNFGMGPEGMKPKVNQSTSESQASSLTFKLLLNLR